MCLCQVTQEPVLLCYSKYTCIEHLSNGLAYPNLRHIISCSHSKLIFFSYIMPYCINTIIQKYVTHAVKNYINGWILLQFLGTFKHKNCLLQSLQNGMTKWCKIVMVKVFSKDNSSGRQCYLNPRHFWPIIISVLISSHVYL